MDFRPHGVCSQLIRVDVEDNIVKNVEFIGGCSGNTQGVSRLIRGIGRGRGHRPDDGGGERPFVGLRLSRRLCDAS